MGQVTQTTAEVQSNLDWHIDNASGNGIKLDTTTPAFGWRDIIGDITVRNVGGSNPTFSVYRDAIRQQQFSVNDEAFNVFHMPHDYASGTDLFIHAHWSHNSASVTSGDVTWEFEVTYAKGFDQAPFPATVSESVVQTASTTQYQHMVAEAHISTSGGGASMLDTDDLEVDGLLLVRTSLIANTMNGTPEPFLHTVDIHYQSTGIPTKNKAPNFYT